MTLKKGADHKVELFWSISDKGDVITIKAEAEAPKESWLGLGWGGDDHMMTNADMVIATKQDDVWTVKDYFSTGYEKPTLDDHQDVFDTSAGFSHGKTWMKFSRKLDTSDTAQDRAILPGPFEVAFALGFSSELNNHAHKFAGHQKVTLFNDYNYYKSAGTPSDDYLGEKVPDPVFLEPEFFNREYGSCIPVEQKKYKPKDDQFGNFLVQRAKERIDKYYTNHPHADHARDPKHRMLMYHVAECEVENVQVYSTSSSRIPPCQIYSSPVSLNKDYTPCE